jgi:hypothetical protein
VGNKIGHYKSPVGAFKERLGAISPPVLYLALLFIIWKIKMVFQQ